MMCRWSVGILLIAEFAVAVHAQRAPASDGRLSFEVASIKQNTDGGATPTWMLQPGGVTITAYSLVQLIAIAYDSKAIREGERRP